MSIVNSLLVRHRGAYFIEEDAASIALHGRRRRPFSVADNYTESGARQLAQIELRHLAQINEEVRATGESGVLFTPGESGAPYTDVWPGDRIMTTSWDGGSDLERVQSIAMEQGGNADEVDNVKFSFEIESKQDSVQRRLTTNARMTARGLLGGQSDRVSPIRQSDGQVASGYLQGQDMNWAPKVFEVSESPRWTFQKRVRPYLARFTWLTPATSPSVMQVRKNGVPITVGYYNITGDDIVVPALTGSMWCLIRDLVVEPSTEVMTAAVTIAGAGGNGFAVQLYTAVVN